MFTTVQWDGFIYSTTVDGDGDCNDNEIVIIKSNVVAIILFYFVIVVYF